MLRHLSFLMLLMSLTTPVFAAHLWETLPPTPAPVAGAKTGWAESGGARIYYSVAGQGAPILVLHGGLANSDYMGNQIHALMPSRQVIAIDSRGHGRSTRTDLPFSYDSMADDVVAVMNAAGVEKADVVGWSDGAIIGLDLALRYPDRVGKIFAFAANTDPSGVNSGVEEAPTFKAYINRAAEEYRRYSATPANYDGFVDGVSAMWASQPHWSAADLSRITSPVLVVQADHDEAIKREHSEYMAAHIPQARLMILNNVSHFAFLQDPGQFNRAMLAFLNGEGS